MAYKDQDPKRKKKNDQDPNTENDQEQEQQAGHEEFGDELEDVFILHMMGII